MTPELREQFLAERKTGVGGSDCASVFNAGYGCRRRLWYDKSGVKPDYPREQSRIMQLGNVLEPFFRRMYEEETGREVSTVSEPFGTFRHPDHPEILVHIDGAIFAPDKERTGVLEIKSVGRAMFYEVKRNGLPIDYIFQEQHALVAVQGEWGSYAVGSRDNGDLLNWDVERDTTICDEIYKEVPIFWKSVGDWNQIPVKLESSDDDRCQECQYRLTCRGDEFVPREVKKGAPPEDDSLRPLKMEYQKRQDLVRQASELLEETKAEFKAALGDREEVTIAGKPTYFRTQAGKVTWNGEAMAETLGAIILKLLETRDPALRELVKTIPEPESFKKQGNPFKVLRVY